MAGVTLYVLIGIAGTAIAFFLLKAAWRLIGYYKVRKAGPPPLSGAEHILWRDPGNVAQLDLACGSGGSDGRPAPPFDFLEEHHSGSQPCVSVRDERGRRWRVKWGSEVHSETFAVRFVWACGYFAETTHFVAKGVIRGANGLTRASSCVQPDGCFTDARFELDDPAVLKLFEEHSWSWNETPFTGTPQLAGLKILTMLLSNWDNKDRRDVARGSNTGIFVHRASRNRSEAHYLIIDWGASMGRWGATIVTRGRWDAAGFAAQTPQFVAGIDGEQVSFGYAGQRTSDTAAGITAADVRWLCRYLGKVTDTQIEAALTASGATSEEKESFTTSLRSRIEQLQAVAGGAIPAAAQSPDRSAAPA